MFRSLRLPVLCSPMFIVSNVDLVVAQCRAGLIGSFPSLNARTTQQLDEWLVSIKSQLQGSAHKTFAVNLIAHTSNKRFQPDLDVILKHQVPIVITSLRSLVKDVIESVHEYNGVVFHDVTTYKHARKAADAGVDGLVLVCAGAGGHAGVQSPFALLPEVKQFFKGTTVLAGSIAHGRSILAAEALGADLSYIGTRFIATTEANADPRYKEMIVNSRADDIVYTNSFSGVHANYLRQSIVQQGLDPDQLAAANKSKLDFSESDKSNGRSTNNTSSSDESKKPKAWRDIWSAGQGNRVGQIHGIQTTAAVVAQLEQEYNQAKSQLRAGWSPPPIPTRD